MRKPTARRVPTIPVARVFFVALEVAFLLARVLPCRADDVLAGRIFSLQGQARLSRDDGQSWSDAVAFQDLYAGDTIRTEPLSRIAILLVDQSMMKIDADTTVKLITVLPSDRIKMGMALTALAKAQQSLYNVLSGRVWLRSDSAFTVETPTVAVGVRGTELAVAVRRDGETVVSMLEGSVAVSNAAGSVIVHAGEEAVAEPGKAPVKRLLLAPEDAVQWALSYPSPVSFRDYFFLSPDPNALASLLQRADEGLIVTPDDPALLIQKGRILHDMGRWDDARTFFQQALASPTVRSQAMEGLGWVELQLGNRDEALQNFKAVDPATEMSVVGESLAMYAGGKAERGLELTNRSLTSIGRTPRLLTQAAFFNLLFGRASEALADLREASSAGDARAAGLESNVCLALNQKDQALEKALDAVRRNPWSATAYVDLAWARQAHFDLPGATAAARKAVELDPRNVRALMTYAQLLFGSGYLSEAEELVAQILRASPEEAEAHTLRGFLLLARRAAAPAIEAFERAIRADDTQANPHLGLGIAYMRESEVEHALEEMLVATLLEPRVSLNYTYLGKALYQVREFRGALKMLERAKTLDPRDPSPHLYAGIINTDLNRGAQAIGDLERSVQLNDNRAVYRARFLLDEDRAVKNVNLARTYANLGLNAMARNRAVLSLMDDPTNSSAHLFMADVLINQKDRTAAAGSELLKALLLQPANQNTFNTFNTYTSFFEEPGLEGSPQVDVGNHDTQIYTANFWGSWRDLAAREIFIRTTSDRFKDNNFTRSWQNFTQLKYQIGTRHDLLFVYERLDDERGDQSTDQNAFAREDHDLTNDSDISRFTLGYHFRVSPQSDILLVLKHDKTKFTQHDGPLDEVETSLGPGVTAQQSDDRLRLEQTYWHVAGTHQFRLAEHRVAYGFETFRGDNELTDTTEEALTIWEPPPIYLSLPPIENETSPRYVSGYAQDTWRIHPLLALQLGLFLEHTKNGSPVPFFSGRQFEITRLNPRAGFVANPTRQDTVRFGFARYLLTPFLAAEQLGPTDIAGFTVGQNALPSSSQEDFSLAWETQMHHGVFLRSEGFARSRTERYEDPTIEDFRRRDIEFYGGSITGNLFLGEYFGLTPSYAYVYTREDAYEFGSLVTPQRSRDDHEVRLGLFFWHPCGWMANAAATFISQRLHGYDAVSPDDFWLLDAAVQKELFDKRLIIGARGENLLDEKFNMITDALSIEQRFPARRFVFFGKYNF